MNQQMSKLVTQALVIIIGVIYTYYQQHRAKIDAAVKDNQAAKTALDIVNKTAVFVVHKLEAGDLDNKDKQVQAVKLVQSTLQTLGLPVLGDEVIAGAVESAVSAMHLAYDTQNQQPRPSVLRQLKSMLAR
ncbi:phage holin [Lacticaseibacillus saniviri]|uniref:phage holin n=1 Tax=Lacticaseibacillus saniviri TaxID=931533 RepID=UPI0006D16351|nr:phage holin [Lacticaseibacillus saniviri]